MLSSLFGKKPASHAVRLAPANVEFRTGPKETLLQAALAQGIAFPHSCRAGGCGECKCRLLKGKVKELTDKSYLLSAEEIRDNYVLACQSIPQTDVEVAVELRDAAAAPAEASPGRILHLLPLTHDILQVTVELERALAYTPGQYAELAARGGRAAGVTRRYSFAGAPEANGTARRVEFFIRRVPGGVFTEWLFGEAQPGDVLDVTAPHGDFVLRDSAAPMLLVAGGSGLAPVLSMLRGALATLPRPRDVTLVFGARTQADLYMQDAIEALRREWPMRFEYVPVLANEPAGSDWPGRRGLIADHLPDVLGASIAAQQAYLCGPPGMVDSCSTTLVAAGVPAGEIHADRFLDQSHMAPAKKVA
ncbi:MAG: 2Fe-2S iron-sulfur cluster binding domain-containing protein [Steroidobacteraceae bacterium]